MRLRHPYFLRHHAGVLLTGDAKNETCRDMHRFGRRFFRTRPTERSILLISRQLQTIRFLNDICTFLFQIFKGLGNLEIYLYLLFQSMSVRILFIYIFNHTQFHVGLIIIIENLIMVIMED